jgi:hypothetical protein
MQQLRSAEEEKGNAYDEENEEEYGAKLTALGRLGCGLWAVGCGLWTVGCGRVL